MVLSLKNIWRVKLHEANYWSRLVFISGRLIGSSASVHKLQCWPISLSFDNHARAWQAITSRPLLGIKMRTWYDDVIKCKHFPRYWPFERGIHRSSVNSPYKGQWRGILMFSLICAWINGLVNNREAGDLRRNRAHYDVIVMTWKRLPHYWAFVIGRYPSQRASNALLFCLLKKLLNILSYCNELLCYSDFFHQLSSQCVHYVVYN